jgi:hypothetical protein
MARDQSSGSCCEDGTARGPPCHRAKEIIALERHQDLVKALSDL